MKFPYWRHVQSTDDGCSIYQCLWCMVQWESRTSPCWGKWKFCPVCGYEWKGEHECVEHNWKIKALCEKYDIEHTCVYSPSWIVQCRTIDEDGVVIEIWHQNSFDMDSLFQAHKYAKAKRSEKYDSMFNLKNEYRVVRWYPLSLWDGVAVAYGEAISPALQKFIQEKSNDLVIPKLSGEKNVKYAKF